ncbi:hypothetical protein NP493_20g08056 [Ridgeia piscesae]|uniref:Uncharacterized protein n=1 Tax=Ridgeia piscesae TaxID=27915 RepID=A0AAD9PDZ6_RIDPI|nr:hypothetical protein NP493_20g08056 [Ridgeia piscesae]
MVVPTSTEYTRSYKPKVFVRAGRLYDENLEFRLQKREMEQNHTTSPFMWDPSDLETDSSDRSSEQQRPMSVPPHKYKHEKFNRSYQKRLLQQQQQQQQEEEEMDYSSPERRGRSKERRGRQERSPSRSQSRGRCSGESVPRPSKPPRHNPAQMNGRHTPTFMDGVAVLRDQGVQTPDWTKMKGRKTVHPSASFESSSSGMHSSK